MAHRAQRCTVGYAQKNSGRIEYDEPTAANGHPERDAELRVALARLPEQQRTAVFLRYYADLDYAAIGEALGIRTGTVAATLNSAHTTLPHPTGGGPHMTDVDRSSLDRILPATPGSPDWDDVLRRSGRATSIVAGASS